MYENVNFPGWDVVRKIGEGSFGGVYEVHRTLPDGRVEKAALKKLTVPKDNSEIRELYSQSFSRETITAHYKEQVRELAKEYTLTQELNSCKNVVACHDVQCVQHADGIGWDIYIRMELLKPLKLVLSADYQEMTVLKLGLSLCNALLACQEHHIVHRDIKPENILVSDRGEFKLGDFGIAKVSEKTATGTMTGTMGYMAPEVANRWHYGAQADIYSLGMVLYWMMNRRTLPFLPFPPAIPTAAQRQEAANRRFAGESFPPPVNGSRALKAIVMKACAFSTEDRYQTVRELSRDLYACYQQRRAGKNVDVSIPADTDEAVLTNELTSGNTYSGNRSFRGSSQNEKTGTLKTSNAKTNDSKTGRFAAPPERPKKRRAALICILVALCLCFASITGYLLMYGFRLVRQSASTRETEVDISDTSAPTQETVPPTTTEPIVYNENMGTVTNQISVRVTPSKDANVTGTLDAGTVVEILRQKTIADITWGMISTPVSGWICMDYVKMYSSQNGSASSETDPNASQPTTAPSDNTNNTTGGSDTQNIKGVINASNLNVRDEASKAGKIVGSYSKGDVVTILETKDGWGRTSKGWIQMEHVNVGEMYSSQGGSVNNEADLNASQPTTSTPSGNSNTTNNSTQRIEGVIIADGLRIRSGPGTTYESVGSYNSGDRVKVLEQFTYGDTTWGYTDKGWIQMKYVDVEYFNDAKSNITSITLAAGAGASHIVGLRNDGTVVAAGWNKYGQCNVDGWKDIVAVAAGAHHTVGLRSDGTVVAVGSNEYGQCDVDGWSDIMSVAAGFFHTVGLRRDGTVVATGLNDCGECDVDSWSDIVAVTAGMEYTVGLHSDGTAVATGNNKDGQCDINANIVAVSAGGWHTVGLRSDGTVVATGSNREDRCDVDSWTNVVAVAAGSAHTVGLRRDGTVVATGRNDEGQCRVDSWTNVVAVAAGSDHTVGLRSDGTVVVAGRNSEGQYKASDWKNIRLPQ